MIAVQFFPQVCPKDLEDILRDVDLNGDGLVDFEGTFLLSSLTVVTRSITTCLELFIIVLPSFFQSLYG